MSTVIEIIVNFYQGFLMLFFMQLRLPSRERSPLWIDLLFECFIGCFLCLYIFLPITLPDTVVFLLPFLYTFFTKRGRWWQRIFWTFILGMVFIFVALTMTEAYSHIFDISMDELLQTSTLRYGFLLTSNVTITVILMVLAKVRIEKNSIYLGTPSFIVFIISLLLEFVTAELLYYRQVLLGGNDIILLIVSICVFGLMLLTLLLHEILTQSAKNKHIAEMQLQTLTSDLNHQKEITVFYNEMLSVQHDLRKQINTIKQIIGTSSNIDKDAILDLIGSDKPLSIRYLTGCTAVDAVLTAKHAAMDQSGIEFSLQPYPLQELPIESSAFCILLSNILDNAIEATLRIEDASVPKSVSLQFARSWDMFYISCTNTMNPSTIEKHGDKFVTSKENKRIHGFGIESICRMVAENGGRIRFTTIENEFRVHIVLPNKESSNDRVHINATGTHSM